MKKLLSMCVALMLCIAMLSGCAGGGTTVKDFSNTEGVSYVMIYNPNIYDELEEVNDNLNTGDFGAYVEAVINKADGLEEKEQPAVMSQSISEVMNDVPLDKFDIGGSRGGSFIAPYSVGDTHQFYCGTEARELKTFVCRYAGENCNIWTYDNSMSSTAVEDYGKEFDENIYDKMSTMFGEPRFADNGGKVNLLFYPMDGNTGGFFHALDLWASDEVSPLEVSQYCINTDHAIVNINSLLTDYKDFMYSTMAHEFQHLICFTNFFYTAGGINMRTWLNEAMSGYVEEQLYPGAKDIAGHYEAFVESSRIRHGQSMYNFDTTLTKSEFDIGVYGSVYLFSEYLANLSGGDVFSNIHSYWRNSYSSTLNEAEAIVKSVPEDVFNKINSTFDFGEKVAFSDSNESWLSKLTLNYYLSLLKHDETDPKAYEKVVSQTLLYDEINPADIEGGGRVIVALKDGKFEIPEDADYGFVYVGLDENFEVITDYIIQ